MKKILPLLLFSLFFPQAHAADKKQNLQDIEDRMSAEKKKQDETSQKMQSLEKDIKGLQTDLVKTADQVQKNEKEVGNLETELAGLTSRKKELNANIDKDRASLAELVTALERIRRLPPQALIARPGAPLETAQASIVLGAIMPELDRRAEDFKNKLSELENIEADLADNKNRLKSSAEKLKENKEKMEGLMSERQTAIKQTRSEYEDREKEVASLSRKAKDLKDLIQKIEAEKAKREAAKKTKTEKSDKVEGKKRKEKVDESKLGGSLASLGNSRLPVAGTIYIKYGQEDGIGASSEGLHINSRPGSVVVAPLKGVVRYAGPFKSYGSIILLEHKNNYHSLIAGLGRIDTVVGQSVEAGEPLGNLGSSSLYYELRFNGQPINPARKFAGLG